MCCDLDQEVLTKSWSNDTNWMLKKKYWSTFHVMMFNQATFYYLNVFVKSEAEEHKNFYVIANLIISVF